jgi:large subunit ribosomal protein L7/L12
MPKTEDIVDALSAMTVLEVLQLAKSLAAAWGVEVDGAGAVHAGTARVTAARFSEEDRGPATFDVVLIRTGDFSSSVVKLVREITGLDLRTVQHLVATPPKVIIERIPKIEADAMKRRFEELGAEAKVELTIG